MSQTSCEHAAVGACSFCYAGVNRGYLDEKIELLTSKLKVAEEALRQAGIHANHQDCEGGHCSPCDYLELVEQALTEIGKI